MRLGLTSLSGWDQTEEQHEKAEGVRPDWPSEQRRAGQPSATGAWPALLGVTELCRPSAGRWAEVKGGVDENLVQEVYAGLSPQTQCGLALLHDAPVLDREIAQAILGGPLSKAVCQDAMSAGMR